MSISVSPQMRIVLLVAGVAALGMVGFMFMQARSASSTQADAVATIKPLHPVHKTPAATHPAAPKVAHRAAASAKAPKAPVARATKSPASAKATTAAAHRVATTTVAAVPTPNPAAVTTTVATPTPTPVVDAKGLPPVLVRALERHPIVVVSLFDPESAVDRISLEEASAGAAAANAGFVPLSVLSQAQIGPLTRTLGLLSDPGVLIYRRPGDIAGRFDGFVDRDTVAQAVDTASATATP